MFVKHVGVTYGKPNMSKMLDYGNHMLKYNVW